jgi:hypothetical protein
MNGALAVAEQASLELDVSDLNGCQWHDDFLLLLQALDNADQHALDDDERNDGNDR